MTPEQKMMKTLVSRDEEKQKLASMSADDLATFLKSANGDMLQYYQGHPEKLKAKQERDAKKEKKAAPVPPQTSTDLNPSSRGVEPSDYCDACDRVKTSCVCKKEKKAYAEKDLVPGGLADSKSYKNFDPKKVSKGEKVEKEHTNSKAVAREIASDHLTEDKSYYEKLQKMEKKSEVAMAEKWARELAQKEKIAISFNGVNEASKFIGRVSRLAEKHGPAVKEFAGKAGKKVYEGVSNVGNRIGGIKDPIVKGMATGGVIGGVGGAAQGFLDPKENPYTGEKQRVRTALRKGMAGAAGGAVSGALIGSMSKSSSMKLAAIPGLGAIGAAGKNFIASMAPTAHKALNAATPALKSGISRLGGATMGQAAGAGAVGGAALGAAKGFVAPGQGPNGQQKSRLGGMARGAVGGAVLGGAAGAGAKAALPKMQQFAAKKLGP